MATAFKGGAFEYYGRQYRDVFARFHVELEPRETAGADENIKLLQDPNSDVEIAFVVGGISDGKHAPGLLSLGTLWNQPFWIFYSSNEPFDRLSQLKGKRIAVRPVGSGTRLNAEHILGKGGVNSETATLSRTAAVEALNDGKVDAVWTISAPDAPAVQSLLKNPNVRLMSFPIAEAFTIIFPDLVRLVLPRAVIDIDRNIPAMTCRSSKPLPKCWFAAISTQKLSNRCCRQWWKYMVDEGFFRRSGEFPNSTDTEYPVAPAAIDFYKNGPSFMQRHVPLWLSVHAQRGIAVLVAAIALGLPTARLLPLAYNWITRRRLFYWYAQLKALEASFDGPMDKHLSEKQAEIERIEEAVSHIRFPLTFSGPAV